MDRRMIYVLLVLVSVFLSLAAFEWRYGWFGTAFAVAAVAFTLRLRAHNVEEAAKARQLHGWR